MRDEDQEQLERVVTLVRDVLARDVVGGYLFGSAVLGGLKPLSDLDVLVVSKRATTGSEKQQLVERLLAISGRPLPTGRWRRVELTILLESELRPWRYPPSFDFQYGDWLRSEFEAGNVEPWPTTTSPDLASLITMVLLANTPLLGPAPADVFEPVPHDDLVSAIVSGIDPLLAELDSDTVNVILTLARIWSTLATGTFCSKDAAADWVLPRLPEEHRPTLARARALYLGEDEPWDDLQPRVRRCADHLVAELRRLERSASERS